MTGIAPPGRWRASEALIQALRAGGLGGPVGANRAPKGYDDVEMTRAMYPYFIVYDVPGGARFGDMVGIGDVEYAFQVSCFGSIPEQAMRGAEQVEEVVVGLSPATGTWATPLVPADGSGFSIVYRTADTPGGVETMGNGEQRAFMAPVRISLYCAR